MTHPAQDSAVLSQRAVVLAAIVGLHIALAVVLSKGLKQVSISSFIDPLVATFVDPPERVVSPPPPPLDPNLVQPVIDVGPVPPGPNEPVADGGTALTQPDTTVLVGRAVITQPPPEVIRLVGKHRLPNSEDYYPADLRRRGIEGAANVRVCVDEAGKVRGAPTVEQSSGNTRLDEGALNVTRDGHYARAMQGASFVPNCYGFRIIFQMK